METYSNLSIAPFTCVCPGSCPGQKSCTRVNTRAEPGCVPVHLQTPGVCPGEYQGKHPGKRWWKSSRLCPGQPAFALVCTLGERFWIPPRLCPGMHPGGIQGRPVQVISRKFSGRGPPDTQKVAPKVIPKKWKKCGGVLLYTIPVAIFPTNSSV